MYRNFIKKLTFISFIMLITNYSGSLFAGELQFGGFSQLSFGATDNEAGSTTSNSNTFSQGGIDLYITKSLDEKTNILAEVVFEISGENEAILDPERIWIQHEINPWFRVKAGRVHTALGYWNESYHHGAWLQTTVERPIMLDFEDDGGLLPVHSIGFEFRGDGEVGAGKMGYIVDIGNGRGQNPDPPQTGADYDRNKAISGLFYYEMNMGLRFGFVFSQDTTEMATDFNHDGDETTAGVNRAGFSESITGAHVVWNGGGTEVIFEGYSVAHKYDADEAAATTITGGTEEDDNTAIAYYLQVGHKINKWTPYFRYGTLQTDKDAADSYLGLAADTTKTKTTLGARYDLTYTSAVKLEYANEIEETGSTENFNNKSFVLNWSYAW